MQLGWRWIRNWPASQSPLPQLRQSARRHLPKRVAYQGRRRRGPVCRRRQHRRAERIFAERLGTPPPAVRDRKQSWRRRHHRCRLHDQVGRGRLHVGGRNDGRAREQRRHRRRKSSATTPKGTSPISTTWPRSPTCWWHIPSQVSAKTLPELIAWLKANPEDAYATSGIGSSRAHLRRECSAQRAGVEMSAVAYRASELQMQETLPQATSNSACDNFSTAWDRPRQETCARSQSARRSATRLRPDVPTFAKSLPGFEVLSAFGWDLAQRSRQGDCHQIIAELSAIGQEPEVRSRPLARRSASSRAAQRRRFRCLYAQRA